MKNSLAFLIKITGNKIYCPKYHVTSCPSLAVTRRLLTSLLNISFTANQIYRASASTEKSKTTTYRFNGATVILYYKIIITIDIGKLFTV